MGLPSALYGKKMASCVKLNYSSGDTLTVSPFGVFNFYFHSYSTDGDTACYYLKIDTTACTIHFLSTWMSNPDHANLGGTIPSDDIDMVIYRDGYMQDGGFSSNHTTEYATVSHGGGLRVYKIKMNLYSRVSTDNHQIFGAVAWAVTN